ncbi:MAG: hypothetical protein AB7F28_03900 [Candidatus Margulisiibacteriota bacterium]
MGLNKQIAFCTRPTWISDIPEVTTPDKLPIPFLLPRISCGSFTFIRDLGIIGFDGVALIPTRFEESFHPFLEGYLRCFSHETQQCAYYGTSLGIENTALAYSVFKQMGLATRQTDLCLEGGNVQCFVTPDGRRGAVIGIGSLLMNYAYHKSNKTLKRDLHFTGFSAKFPKTITPDFLRTLALRFKLHELFTQKIDLTRRLDEQRRQVRVPTPDSETISTVVSKLWALRLAILKTRFSNDILDPFRVLYCQMPFVIKESHDYTTWAELCIERLPQKLSRGLEATSQTMATVLGIPADRMGFVLQTAYHIDMAMNTSPHGDVLLHDPQKVSPQASPVFQSNRTIVDDIVFSTFGMPTLADDTTINESVLHALGLRVFRVAGAFTRNKATVLNLINGVFIDHGEHRIFLAAGCADDSDFSEQIDAFRRVLQDHFGYTLALIPQAPSKWLYDHWAGVRCITLETSPGDVG